MRLQQATHKAIDYFFCDRCVAEELAKDAPLGIAIEYVCVFSKIWSLVEPDEPFTRCRRIYWPRTALAHTKYKVMKEEERNK